MNKTLEQGENKEIAIEGITYRYDAAPYASGSTCNVYVAKSKQSNRFLKVIDEPNSEAKKQRLEISFKNQQKVLGNYPNYFINWNLVNKDDFTVQWAEFSQHRKFSEPKEISALDNFKKVLEYLNTEIKCFYYICLHVEHIHDEGYVHLDLKRDNVLIFSSTLDPDYIRLIDFDSLITKSTFENLKNVTDFSWYVSETDKDKKIIIEEITSCVKNENKDEGWKNLQKYDVYCLGKMLAGIISGVSTKYEEIKNKDNKFDLTIELFLKRLERLGKKMTESMEERYAVSMVIDTLLHMVDVRNERNADQEIEAACLRDDCLKKIVDFYGEKYVNEYYSINKFIMTGATDCLESEYDSIDAIVKHQQRKNVDSSIKFVIEGEGGLGKTTGTKKFLVEQLRRAISDEKEKLCIFVPSTQSNNVSGFYNNIFGPSSANMVRAIAKNTIFIFDGINEIDPSNCAAKIEIFSEYPNCIITSRKIVQGGGVLQNEKEKDFFEGFDKYIPMFLTENQITEYESSFKENDSKMYLDYELKKYPMLLVLLYDNERLLEEKQKSEQSIHVCTDKERVIETLKLFGAFDQTNRKLCCENKADVIANYILLKEQENAVRVLLKYAYDNRNNEQMSVEIAPVDYNSLLGANGKTFSLITKEDKPYLTFLHQDFRDVLIAMYIANAIIDFTETNRKLDEKVNENFRENYGDEKLDEVLIAIKLRDTTSEDFKNYSTIYNEVQIEKRKENFQESIFKQVMTPIDIHSEVSEYVRQLLGDFD